MDSVIRIIDEEASFCDQEFEVMLQAAMRNALLTYTPVGERAEEFSPQRVMGDWASLANNVVAGNRVYGCSSVSMDMKPLREHRFDALRAEGKKLGEINAILEAEGYSEVFGEGVMPAPTKSHQIVRENKGARKMVETMGGQ